MSVIVTFQALSLMAQVHHAFGCWHGDFRLRRQWGEVRRNADKIHAQFQLLGATSPAWLSGSHFIVLHTHRQPLSGAVAASPDSSSGKNLLGGSSLVSHHRLQVSYCLADAVAALKTGFRGGEVAYQHCALPGHLGGPPAAAARLLARVSEVHLPFGPHSFHLYSVSVVALLLSSSTFRSMRLSNRSCRGTCVHDSST